MLSYNKHVRTGKNTSVTITPLLSARVAAAAYQTLDKLSIVQMKTVLESFQPYPFLFDLNIC